jgi:hypothetical protein
VCRARSLQGVTKALVCIARTMSWNSADDSVRSLLFLDNAYAIDKYKWESRWKTQLAPSARSASFPVSFWASDTLKQHWLGCQVKLSRSRTSWRYLTGITVVSLLVSIMSPRLVLLWTNHQFYPLIHGKRTLPDLDIPLTHNHEYSFNCSCQDHFHMINVESQH